MTPKKKPGQETGLRGVKFFPGGTNLHSQYTQNVTKIQSPKYLRDIYALIGQAYFMGDGEIVTALCELVERKRGNK